MVPPADTQTVDYYRVAMRVGGGKWKLKPSVYSMISAVFQELKGWQQCHRKTIFFKIVFLFHSYNHSFFFIKKTHCFEQTVIFTLKILIVNMIANLYDYKVLLPQRLIPVMMVAKFSTIGTSANAFLGISFPFCKNVTFWASITPLISSCLSMSLVLDPTEVTIIHL